ncbi:UbiH/UbiF family hydroxylase [Rhodobacteraceae bacterium DSL-40]|uniref:UbiH/UbiF family hydroxylase n=1 Tax=Amaricoccus sp. B4 TaxID=3368557 RepID=UPI000DAD21F1
MERFDTDILVAGGGAAGLAATAAFATEGFRVTCVDPVPPAAGIDDPGSDMRSTAFLMPSVRLLERAGLWAKLVPHAAPLRIMRLADAGGPEPVVRETADFVADEAGEPAFGYNVPNWLMRREMVASLRGMPRVTLRMGTRVEHLTPRTCEAVVRLADGTSLRARLVIAADGRDSAVREMCGISARRWGYGQKAVVFTVAHSLPHHDVSTEIHRSGGPFTLVPLPDHDGRPHSAVVWMERGPRAVELGNMPPEAFERELNERACGVLGPLELASPRRVWPIISQVSERLCGPRTALVAEAAHVIPPIGAQGLNMSLRDIATLRDLCVAAREAGGDIGNDDLLRRYHWKRHPDILARIAGVDALNRAAMEDTQRLRDLRLAGLKALHGVRPARRLAMSMGLGAGS